jgi:hypothetical protein
VINNIIPKRSKSGLLTGDDSEDVDD